MTRASRIRSLILGVALSASLVACTPPSDVTLSALFTDGMVLQRDSEVSVWGSGQQGSTVTIDFRDTRYDTQVGPDGTWLIRLAPGTAGGPFDMRVSSHDFEHTLSDVLVGDVWVASGQSNMEWTVASSWNAEAEIAEADDAMIRQFKVPHIWSGTPVDTVVGGPWQRADPDHVGAFTAVGYYFAREIRAHHDVPIGLLNTSWGGSRVEPWMSPEALGLDAAGVREILDAETARGQALRDAVIERIGSVPDRDEGLVDGVAVWADPDLDTSTWIPVRVPAQWESQGFDGFDGIAWYRTAFDLTKEEAAAGVTLGLGRIDDSDRTWVNGVEVGGMAGAWNVPRVYEVGPTALREGSNVISVRVVDTGGGGGIAGSADEVYVESEAGRRPLSEEWSFTLGELRLGNSGAKNQVSFILYNAMVHPLLRFPITGVIWYQGESNAGADDAVAYSGLFSTLIQDWRARWGSGDFPFLFVQLAGFQSPAQEPAEGGWAVLRESQAAALAVANTAQAVTIDVGEAEDIHPRNKQDVGHRLALAARALEYGESIVYSGPTYRSHTIEDGRVIVEFDHVGGRLRAVARPIDAPRAEGRANEGVLTGFAIAGADQRFVWADARIDGDRVIVSSPRVRRPVAVRYAWASNPDQANLYNAEGLPASPFRTDGR